MFEKGVNYYTKGIAIMDVFFPEDQVKCYWCNFCRKDDMGRYFCRLTNEMLYSPTLGLGNDCPITIIEKEIE